MSTLKVTNIQDTAGGNSSTSEEIYSGRAKAWVNFNGTGTVAIRADFNVNTIGDNGTGDYTVNFSNALSDANYVIAGGGFGYNESRSTGRTVTFSSASSSVYNNAINASFARVTIEQTNGGTKNDMSHVHVAIFR